MRSEIRILVIFSLAVIIIVSGVVLMPGSEITFCADCDGNFPGTTLVAATLYGVSNNNSSSPVSALSICIKNAGANTTISSLTLTGPGLSSPISQWSLTPDNKSAIDFNAPYATRRGNGLNGSGSINSFVLYALAEPSAKDNITEGWVYNYVVNFYNGQSLSGSLTDQGPTSFPISYSFTDTTLTWSESSSTCTIVPYTTLQTINSSQGIYTTLETYSC